MLIQTSSGLLTYSFQIMVTRYICLLFLLLLPLCIPAQNVHRAQKDSLRHALSLTAGKEKLDTYYRLSQLYNKGRMPEVWGRLLPLWAGFTGHNTGTVKPKMS
jgi:hypothetical protein